ncbi:basic proline-rich protein-like [Empidonax traillii]|uniref:basic proline-rich protein-like n=1 Tax=Empidonax traillii TaxID=164674 RepID=UPI000FFCECC1|nr:basic proline-rich protein-like [Empidonax traillii]
MQMSTASFVSGKGRARASTVLCRCSERATRFSLNLHCHGLQDYPRKGRSGPTLQHVPNSSHGPSRNEPARPRGARCPPRAVEASPCDCSAAGRLHSAGAGPSPGHGGRAKHGRPGRGSPDPPPGPTRGLRGARSAAGPGGDPPADTKSRQGRPRPGGGIAAGPRPRPPHRPPPRLTARRVRPSPAWCPAQPSPPSPIYPPAEPTPALPPQSRSRTVPAHPPASPRPQQLLPRPRRRLLPGNGRRQARPGQQQLTGGARSARPSRP